MASAADTVGRSYQLVIWGASGFTGRLAVTYLAKQQARGRLGAGNLQWALGGRDKLKLEQVRRECCEAFGASNVGIVTADATDSESLSTNVTTRTNAVLSFAGPYDSEHGRNLLDSCVHNHADYFDITGELSFMTRSVNLHHSNAQHNGSLIVHTVGFDSVPCDVSSYVAAKAASASEAAGSQGKCTRVESFITDVAGGSVSGGTLESAAGQLSGDIGPLNSYAPEAPTGSERNTQIQRSSRYSEVLQSWTAGSPGAVIDTRVMLRSGWLLPHIYEPNYSFVQGIVTGSYLVAAAVSSGTALATGVISSQTSRRALQRAGILKKQGEGPTKKQRNAGYFNVCTFASASNQSDAKNRHDKTLHICHFGACQGHLDFTADPGYSGAAAMGVLAALTAVQRRSECAAGGVHTPSSALGDEYVNMLRNAGFTVTCAPWEPGSSLPNVSNK